MAYVSMNDLAQVTADQRAEQIRALEANASALEANAASLERVQPSAAAALRANAAAMRKTADGLRGTPAAAPSMLERAKQALVSPLGLGLAAVLVGGGVAIARRK